MSNSKATTKSINAPCPGCGNQMSYAAEKQKLSCDYCGHTQTVEECNKTVKETALKEFLLKTLAYIPQEIGEHLFSCDNCGSQFMTTSEKVNLNCGFCGSQHINEAAFNKKLIQPNGILPFKINKEDAQDKFLEWSKKGWFSPNKLHKAVHDFNLHGIYIPFWAFNADIETYYEGYKGRAYYVTTRVNGKKKRKREIDWTPVEGNLDFSFKDILVVATDHIQQPVVEKLLPFRTKDLQSFDSRYLKGWETDVYSVEVDNGYDSADLIMNAKINEMINFKIGGDEQLIDHVDTLKFNQSFKHILLPIFICSYMYQNDVFQFAINGQSGKVVGKRPLSKNKIAIAITIAVILLLIFTYFSSKY